MVIMTLSLLFSLAIVTLCTPSFQGVFTTGQNILELTYTPTSLTSYLHFQLYLSPFYSSALLVGRNENLPVSTNQQDWIHYDYLQDEGCDYAGMVSARTQYGWVNNLGSNSTLYLKLINFDLSTTFSYIINVTESNSLLKTCISGIPKGPNQYFCGACSNQYIGPFCEIERTMIGISYQYYGILRPQSYSYFHLLSQKQIFLSLTYDSDVTIYIQTQDEPNQLAGVSNYMLKHALTSNSSITIPVNGGGKSILVGVINPNQNPVAFSLVFKEQIQADIIFIIVSVLGGAIVITVIIVGVIILKRKMSNQNRNVITDSFFEPNRKFSEDQMEIYFPSIQMAIIQCRLEISFDMIKENEQKNETECIICLSAIQNKELIRVGYCKHIFHASCLYEWFRKHQSCPYCRRDYSRQSTIEHYNLLVRKAGKSLKGEQIAKSVLGRNQNASINNISICTTKQTFD